MRRSRLATAVCLLLGILALALPAGALAGGSAGNQQYTDPFGSSTHHATTSQTAPSNPAPTTAAAPTATTPVTSPSSGGADPPSVTTTTAAAASSSGTLPYSGFAVPTAAGFGAVLILGGIGLRRRTSATR